MTSAAFDDQFAVSPEEDALFQERQAREDEQAKRIKLEQRAEDDAIEAINSVIHGQGHDTREARCRSLYSAIRDGRIPGVEIKRGDV